MNRWRWRTESPLTRTMAGARLCRQVWHVASPHAGFAARLFCYADGEVTLYTGPDASGAMAFAFGLRGPGALGGCIRELRALWADRLARLYAGLDA
jgi:hypothetical protein